MQWCLQTGTDYCELNDLHKPLYLEAAGVRLVEFGIKGTVSVFSLLSGLHRKDILKPVNMRRPKGQRPSRVTRHASKKRCCFKTPPSVNKTMRMAVNGFRVGMYSYGSATPLSTLVATSNSWVCTIGFTWPK
jgi:hypothetical protein